MSRCIVNVATGRYVAGQLRLKTSVSNAHAFVGWTDELPPGSPAHAEIPFAFKAWALEAARRNGYTTLLWADSCILPVRDLAPLWERIERDGYWIGSNSFWNAEWTCPEAYEYLGITPRDNERIRHVVATTFGLDLSKEIGRAIFSGYLRLAQTRAFCGATTLLPGTRASRGDRLATGHRHDQTALSILAHRGGCKLTHSPEVFAYRGGEDETTILVADGGYL